MAIDVYVREYSGEKVATLDWRGGVNRLCATAAADPTRFPLLSGVDDHDDTYFNARQCVILTGELESLTKLHTEPEVRGPAEALLQLVDLLRAAPGRPHHRLLVFSGD
ncbi:hypothetical protein Val02_73340 [Virgisporangium aliadipatigenens]|uniref:Uncharacterized protein n=1 Tax=Virgisporangium aliadipatigenens TaxID=741659 RepID=A0A8J3YU08_9ACTN|nr:hypothetical protein [Virgisporangium aliadipatigenens]GIJ50448.1 hypothetical protein Val02_73340 [Virgisporangium aliadipatigenens]